MATEIETSGEFKGWTMWPDEEFEHRTAGPFYFTTDENGPVCAFRAAPKHMNSGGVVHGGCLMAFADFALFGIAHDVMDGAYGLTVAFTSEFISGPKVGSYIEARGEVVGGGKSLKFVRGVMTADGEACLNFSGTIKRLKQHPAGAE